MDVRKKFESLLLTIRDLGVLVSGNKRWLARGVISFNFGETSLTEKSREFVAKVLAPKTGELSLPQDLISQDSVATVPPAEHAIRRVGGADPADVIAAARRAGFSMDELLASFNRVHGDRAVDASDSITEPPEYDGAIAQP